MDPRLSHVVPELLYTKSLIRKISARKYSLKQRFLVSIILSAILLLVLSSNLQHPVFAQEKSSGCSTETCSSNSQCPRCSDTREVITPKASIKLIPNSGPPGTTFEVFGTGFYSKGWMRVESDFGNEIFNVDNSGVSIGELTVPANTPPGKYKIHAEILADWKKIVIYGNVQSEAFFVVTGQTSNTVHSNIKHPSPTPPPPPPPPKKPQSSPTSNSANGGSSSIPSITLNPTSGYPGTEVKITGTNFEGTATLSAGGKEITKSSNISGFGDFISIGSDGSLTGQVTIPSDAQPGPYTIQIDSAGPTANAIFTVLKEPTFADIKTTPSVKGPSTPQEQPSVKSSITSDKSTGRMTLPKTTGKTILPTTPSKPTSLTTGKSHVTITPKIPNVKSCPAGSFAISGKCLSKGTIVAILQ